MLTVQDLGEGNTFEVPEDVAAAIDGTVVLHGDGNRVRFGAGCVAQGHVAIALGHGCSVEIGEGVNLGAVFVHAAQDGHVRVGAHSGFNGPVRFLLHEPGRIEVGVGCLLAGQTDLTVSDMHSIVDVASGRRLNPPGDILVGDRVWIGQGTLVLKGSRIGAGSVVGAGAVVRSSLPPETVSAGVPARVVREGATWDFALLPYEPEPEPEPQPRPAPPATGPVPARGRAERLQRRLRAAAWRWLDGPR